MNNTLGVGIWTMASWGLFISPHGNMLVGSILASLMCIFGIAFVWGFFIVIMGLKIYNWNQRIIMLVAFATLIVTGIVLTSASHADFVTAYNDQAAADGSLLYDETIQAVRDADYDIADSAKPGMDWGATLALFPAIAWATAYGYQITFICGEVKRPQRNIVLGQVLAAVIPMVFLVWFSWGLVNVMGQDFLGAVAVGQRWARSVHVVDWQQHIQHDIAPDGEQHCPVLHRFGFHLVQPVMYADFVYRV
jgi:amino acid transporter